MKLRRFRFLLRYYDYHTIGLFQTLHSCLQRTAKLGDSRFRVFLQRLRIRSVRRAWCNLLRASSQRSERYLLVLFLVDFRPLVQLLNFRT